MSGGICFNEFFTAAALTKHICTPERMTAGFKEVDLDGSGGLKIVELTSFLFRGFNVREADIRKMLCLKKTDSMSLIVTYTEFRNMIRVTL